MLGLAAHAVVALLEPRGFGSCTPDKEDLGECSARQFLSQSWHSLALEISTNQLKLQVLLFSSCIRNTVAIKVPEGVSELFEISKI